MRRWGRSVTDDDLTGRRLLFRIDIVSVGATEFSQLLRDRSGQIGKADRPSRRLLPSVVEMPLAERTVFEHSLSPDPHVRQRAALPLSCKVLRSEYLFERDSVHPACHVRQRVGCKWEAFAVIRNHG